MCIILCENAHVGLPFILQSAARTQKQMVTEAERELLRSGKFDELVEEQRRMDAERDAEVNVHSYSAPLSS